MILRLRSSDGCEHAVGNHIALDFGETQLHLPPLMGNPISGATIDRSVTFSMARYAPLLVHRKERILGPPRFLEHCRTSAGEPLRPRATALTKAFPVVSLSVDVSPSRVREIGGDVPLVDSAPLMVTRLFRCELFGSRSPSPCSDLPPTDTSLRASSLKPFEMRAIRTGRRSTVPTHARFYQDRRCCPPGARLRSSI